MTTSSLDLDGGVYEIHPHDDDEPNDLGGYWMSSFKVNEKIQAQLVQQVRKVLKTRNPQDREIGTITFSTKTQGSLNFECMGITAQIRSNPADGNLFETFRMNFDPPPSEGRYLKRFGPVVQKIQVRQVVSSEGKMDCDGDYQGSKSQHSMSGPRGMKRRLSGSNATLPPGKRARVAPSVGRGRGRGRGGRARAQILDHRGGKRQMGAMVVNPKLKQILVNVLKDLLAISPCPLLGLKRKIHHVFPNFTYDEYNFGVALDEVADTSRGKKCLKEHLLADINIDSPVFQTLSDNERRSLENRIMKAKQDVERKRQEEEAAEAAQETASNVSGTTGSVSPDHSNEQIEGQDPTPAQKQYLQHYRRLGSDDSETYEEYKVQFDAKYQEFANLSSQITANKTRFQQLKAQLTQVADAEGQKQIRTEMLAERKRTVDLQAHRKGLHAELSVLKKRVNDYCQLFAT